MDLFKRRKKGRGGSSQNMCWKTIVKLDEWDAVEELQGHSRQREKGIVFELSSFMEMFYKCLAL